MSRYVVCADVGSTFTKALVVEADSGELVGSASTLTTAGTDVLHGLDEAVARAAAGLRGVDRSWLVCSSAGGGLRLAVVGYEELVTARAGAAVGLSAGARLVHVSAGALDPAGVTAVRAAAPDVLLLVGGTDGGDEQVLLHNAARLAGSRWRLPVVLAGNGSARERAASMLISGGVPVTVADNVLPAIGVLRPQPARAAIREVFLRHVIGGKRLSRGRRFASLVRCATPDAVLAGVELLADRVGGDLLVVDVGGATTDVYSVLTPDESASGPGAPAAGVLWRARTVEGDLGMRVGAAGVVAAAQAERLLDETSAVALSPQVAARVADPGLVAAGGAQLATDRLIGRLAATVAVRRHARGPVPGERAGRDLRDVRLVIGSGGVLRFASPGDAQELLAAVLADRAGGWALPRAARTVVDVDYVLAAAGLLAGVRPQAAGLLLDRLVTAAR